MDWGLILLAENVVDVVVVIVLLLLLLLFLLCCCNFVFIVVKLQPSNSISIDQVWGTITHHKNRNGCLPWSHYFCFSVWSFSSSRLGLYPLHGLRPTFWLCYLLLQVAGPPKAGAFKERPAKPTSFRKFYDRGDFPIALEHDTKGNKIAWKVSEGYRAVANYVMTVNQL